jgi:3-dehydroquinate synthetase
LAESLKHGLLHDENLYVDVMRLLAASSDPDRFSCFDVAWRTLLIKSSLLASDPFEDGPAKSLLFGHTHAHCLEVASGLRISHGTAVYVGIMVELCAAESPEYSEIVNSLRTAGVIDPAKLPKIEITKLRVAYEYLTSGGDGAGHIRVQRLSRIGEYRSNGLPSETLCAVDVVLNAVKQVRQDLGPAGAFIAD